MAASLAVKRRYTSPVYEDKYFPEKNAAIPFKWETSPGRPKYDVGDYESDDDKQGTCMHRMCNESYTCSNKQCMQESRIHTPQAQGAVSIYPLRPPPRVSPVSALRVKDLLLHSGMHDHTLSDDRFDDDDDQLQLSAHDHCPLHAHPHGFSRLSFRFRSFKASAVVPVYKNHSVIKARSRNLRVDRSPASPLLMHAPFQGRSQSFSHAAKHGPAVTEAKQVANIIGSNVHAGAVLAQAPAGRRRCNSFNFQSACHAFIDHDNKADDDDNLDGDPSSMAAVAVWAGACILAAAAAAHDHHQNDPCRVALKLRDLMQQSANFSELELPTMLKFKKGGGSAMNENLAQLALCHAKIAPVAKKKTKSVEEEVMEAFLREGMRKSCSHDEEYVEDEPTLNVEKATLEGDDQPCKLVKRKSFLKVFKNECIACWCPTPTL